MLVSFCNVTGLEGIVSHLRVDLEDTNDLVSVLLSNVQPPPLTACYR